MPDLMMCPSTVCAVRRTCERNWDSGTHKPDRDPKKQAWVPKQYYGIVWDRNGITFDASKCPYYLNVQQ